MDRQLQNVPANRASAGLEDARDPLRAPAFASMVAR
jgi:hypothetical protein